jgi:hypothetical protein
MAAASIGRELGAFASSKAGLMIIAVVIFFILARGFSFKKILGF